MDVAFGAASAWAVGTPLLLFFVFSALSMLSGLAELPGAIKKQLPPPAPAPASPRRSRLPVFSTLAATEPPEPAAEPAAPPVPVALLRASSSFSLGVPSPSADHAVTARRKEAHLATLRAAGRLLMLQSRTRKGEVGSEELI